MNLLLFLKRIYQEVKIKGLLSFYSLFTPEKNPYELTKKKLARRNANWKKNAPVKVFAVYAVNNWEKELEQPLEQLGELHHFSWPDVKHFFDRAEEWRSFHTALNERLEKAFHRIYDEQSNIIIFLYTSDFIVDAETLQRIRKQNTMVVSFCWDDLLYFKGNVKGQPVGVSRMASVADINLTLSPEAIPRYHFYGDPCFFWKGLPVPVVNTMDIQEQREDFYVLFIGTKYGWRETFIAKLVADGIPVICYGSGWPNGLLTEADMKSAICKAPLTLGFAAVGYTHTVTTIKGRDFEVPLYGGLYLTQFSSGLERYYVPQQEVLAYRTYKECVSQILFVKNNPGMARHIRSAGYQKAMESGTWYSRMKYLSAVIQHVTDSPQT